VEGPRREGNRGSHLYLLKKRSKEQEDTATRKRSGAFESGQAEEKDKIQNKAHSRRGIPEKVASADLGKKGGIGKVPEGGKKGSAKCARGPAEVDSAMNNAARTLREGKGHKHQQKT